MRKKYIAGCNLASHLLIRLLALRVVVVVVHTTVIKLIRLLSDWIVPAADMEAAGLGNGPRPHIKHTKKCHHPVVAFAHKFSDRGGHRLYCC